jgi:probable addiction module antidote protein
MRTKRSSARVSRWDAVEHLHTERDILGYLNAALEEGDPMLVAAVIGDIARAMGMGDVARKAKFGRESLYKALSQQGNPQFGTILRVLDALGIELRAIAKPKTRTASAAATRPQTG